MTLAGAAVTRRFLILRGLRWLPRGLIIPVLVLLLVDKGLTLAQVGLLTAIQGLVVFALELPTGGLADALGRRPVLVAAAVVNLASLTLLVTVDDMSTLAVVFALQGVYRALESGPLDAWYVDAALAADPDAEYDRGLTHGGTVTGLAIGAGSLTASGLAVLAGTVNTDPLVLPVMAAIGLHVVELVAIVKLMAEDRPSRPHHLADSIHDVPSVIRQGTKLVTGSTVLASLVAVELFWGFGQAAFETLFPPLMTGLAGSADQAAILLGPAVTAAWIASAAGAAALPMIARRVGHARAAMAMRLLQGATVAAMGLAAGVVGAMTAYIATYAVHGAANPAHQILLHREVNTANRATVLSINSMAAMPAGGIGAIVLGSIADTAGTTTAILIGAAVLALAAPLYVPARRAERAGPTAPPAPDVPPSRDAKAPASND